MAVAGLRTGGTGAAWNTAVSFVTNTNWQSYSGEPTMGHLVQMAGLAVQNFVSAAVGMASRWPWSGGSPARMNRMGNFWVDLPDPLRILLPIASARSCYARGAWCRTFPPARRHHAGRSDSDHHRRPGGQPGGHQGAGHQRWWLLQRQRAHPFENPNAWTNWVEIFLLLLIPFSLPRVFGRMVATSGRATRSSR